MRCNDYIVWISGHIDGTNSPREEQTLQEHLASCSHCRSLLKEMQDNDVLLKKEALPPPERVVDTVMSTIRKEAKRKTARIRSYILSAAATAAVLCLVLISSLRTPDRPDAGTLGRTVETPTEAVAEPCDVQDELQLTEAPYITEAEAVEDQSTESEAAASRRKKGTSQDEAHTAYHCVFVELPSRDLVPEEYPSLTSDQFYSRITREAQDLYLYGGSIIYRATMMTYEEMQAWESQISYRCLQEHVETDTYIVVFCSESR